MENFKFSDKFVGRTAEGDRIFVDAELRDNGREYETTDHRTVTGQTFAMSGMIIGYRCREAYGAGQMLYQLLEITQPAKGVTMEDIKFLHDAWEAHHLNSMNALCDHQTVKWTEGTYGRTMDLEAIGACPVSGYRPGSAWLYKELPEDTMRRVFQIMSKLESK